MSDFQKKYPFERRCSESKKIRDKFPDKVPIIIEIGNDVDLQNLDKRKFLVPKDITVGQFMCTIRKRMNLNPDKTIFFFVNGMIPPVSELIGQIDQMYKSDDGFLVIRIEAESSFGL